MRKIEDFKIGTRIESERFGKGTVHTIRDKDSFIAVFDKVDNLNLHDGDLGIDFNNKCYFYGIIGCVESINELTIIEPIPDEVKFTPAFLKDDVLICICPTFQSIKKGNTYECSCDSFMVGNMQRVHLKDLVASVNIHCFTKKEQQEFQEITEANIVETLLANGFEEDGDGYAKDAKIIYIDEEGYTYNSNCSIEKRGNICTPDFTEFLAFVQSRVKLVPLVKGPEFDFKKYLLDNGFVCKDGSIYCKSFVNVRVGLETCYPAYGSGDNELLTKEVAKKLIKMAETANE